jgi:GNAT superfamily N-acetyltransferase
MSVPASVLLAADANMRRAWQELLRWSPSPGAVSGVGSGSGEGLVLLSSGVPVPLFNPAFASGVVDPALVVDHYESLGLPFVLYFRDEAAPGLADACSAAGLVEHWQPALMVLDPVPASPPPPAGLLIEPMTVDNIDAYLGVLAEGFGAPRELMDAVFGTGLLQVPGLTGYLGILDGTPVATSACLLSDGVAGVYNVATLPSHRGKGAGAAVTAAAAAAGVADGVRVSVLQASEAGEPVYRRMGFTTPARYRQFEGPPR